MGPSASALELAAALRARELSSLELTDACLAAVDERNPELNAVVWRDDEAARVAARDADARIAAGDEAPFLGVPIPIKDLTPVAGWPVTYGSNGAPEGPSEESELVVEALQRAGFVLCGRTNTPEFGPLTVAENSRYGASRNPWDPNRSPGGSSGGASAAVAGGMFPIGHANDGGGSIRIPAAYTGLVGLKSSRGRVPRRAQTWMGAVVEGAVTRTTADAAAVLDQISGPDPLAWNNALPPQRPFAEEVGADPGSLRIGLMAEAPLGIPTDPACVAAARDAAALLEELGHQVSEVEVPTVSEEMIPPFVMMTNGGLADFIGIDWERTEPHIRHAHEVATTKINAYRVRDGDPGAGAALAPRGRPLGARLRRPPHPHLGDPAAPGRRRPCRPARDSRPTGNRRCRLRLLRRLRQHHRPTGGLLAAVPHRGGSAGRRDVDRRPVR